MPGNSKAICLFPSSPPIYLFFHFFFYKPQQKHVYEVEQNKRTGLWI